MPVDWAVWWSSQNLPLIEWWAIGFALIYVILATRNSAWCWPFAFVSSCLWTYQVYNSYSLYFDAALNTFYAVMAIVGLWKWLHARPIKQALAEKVTDLPISKMTPREHLQWIGIGLALSVVMWVLAKAYTAAELPGPDAVTTVFSIIATILLVQRKLENWLYFFVFDLVYVWIYWERGSPLFSGMFVIYCVISVLGYFNWKSLADRSSVESLP